MTTRRRILLLLLAAALVVPAACTDAHRTPIRASSFSYATPTPDPVFSPSMIGHPNVPPLSLSDRHTVELVLRASRPANRKRLRVMIDHDAMQLFFATHVVTVGGGRVLDRVLGSCNAYVEDGHVAAFPGDAACANWKPSKVDAIVINARR